METEKIVRIPLTQGREAIIDAADELLVHGRSWRYGMTDTQGYAFTGRKPLVYMHRLLLGNPPSSVDHINGDGLDNRRANLRLATNAQNQANRGTPKSNRSGFKGVLRVRSAWRGQIKSNGKQLRSTIFATAREAALWYDEQARRLFGEFARTNF